MGRRFAIVIGVAAAGVMALGAQTALAGVRVFAEEKQSLSRPDQDGGQTVGLVASCGQIELGQLFPINEEPPPPIFNLPDLGCTVRAEGELTNVKSESLYCSDSDVFTATSRTTSAARRSSAPPTRSCVAILPGPHVACGGTTCHWATGGAVEMELELRKKTRKQVRKALAEGKNVKAKVTVDATDSSGNVETAKRTITLVK